MNLLLIENIVFAARADGSEQVIGLIFICFTVSMVFIVALIRGPAHYDVVIKRGAPYCPCCNRQVSYRREHCRSCGYNFVSHGPTPEEKERRCREEVQERQRSQEEEKRRAEERLFASKIRIEKGKQRAQEQIQQQDERNKYYSARGIEPGPLAWFRLLPDYIQAIMLGFAVAIPAVFILVTFLRSVL